MQIKLLDQIGSVHIDLDSANLFCVLGRVSDYSQELYPEERVDWGQMKRQRRLEYSSGRRVAHEALSMAIGESLPVLTDERRPVWPKGWVGSISHTKNKAAAMLGRECDYAGMGIDLALQNSVTERIAERITTPSERTTLAADVSTQIFSAKEAVYKAVNPISREFLGMRDVEIEFDKTGRKFRAKTLHQRRSTKIVTLGVGYIGTVENCWLSVFLVEPF